MLTALATALIIAAASAAPDLPIRMSDPDMRVAVVRAIVRSPTMRRLMAELRRRRAIVYVRWSPVLPPLVRAAVMPRVTDGGDVRYLWVALRPDRVSDSAVALVAHEIQHTIEILDAGVTDAATIGAMYDRLEGTRNNRIHDTPAAQAVGLQVERELRIAAKAPEKKSRVF